MLVRKICTFNIDEIDTMTFMYSFTFCDNIISLTLANCRINMKYDYSQVLAKLLCEFGHAFLAFKHMGFNRNFLNITEQKLYLYFGFKNNNLVSA